MTCTSLSAVHEDDQRDRRTGVGCEADPYADRTSAEPSTHRPHCTLHRTRARMVLTPARVRFGGRAVQGAQAGPDLDGTMHAAHPPHPRACSAGAESTGRLRARATACAHADNGPTPVASTSYSQGHPSRLPSSPATRSPPRLPARRTPTPTPPHAPARTLPAAHRPPHPCSGPYAPDTPTAAAPAPVLPPAAPPRAPPAGARRRHRAATCHDTRTAAATVPSPARPRRTRSSRPGSTPRPPSGGGSAGRGRR
ncbi:hypothetical protein SUDANB15_00135 [Streptomyces sp. enrichment culture]